MKPILLSLMFLFASIASFGQNLLDQIYLDEQMQPTDSVHAVYKRIFDKKSPSYISCEVFSMKTGELRMTGIYAIVGGDLFENGLFTYYHSFDQKESEGHFVCGYKSGVWKRFSEEGEELPEKYYDPEAAKILRRLSNVGIE